MTKDFMFSYIDGEFHFFNQWNLEEVVSNDILGNNKFFIIEICKFKFYFIMIAN